MNELTEAEMRAAIAGLQRDLDKGDTPYGVRYDRDLATVLATARHWFELRAKLEASEAARATLEAVIVSVEDWRSWYAGGAGYPSVGEWKELGRRLSRAGDPVVLREHRVCADVEQHAASFNEGFETAVAQGLADDPEKADEWLREHDAKVLEAAAHSAAFGTTAQSALLRRAEAIRKGQGS